jgi:hypothetical protein
VSVPRRVGELRERRVGAEGSGVGVSRVWALKVLVKLSKEV